MDVERASHDVGVDLAAVARLLVDGTRSASCLALLDGRAWTATSSRATPGSRPRPRRRI
ncbi:hypothetical protein ACFU9X_37450 [Streptomyces atratus]|uniref:hypothetical protein n=1 Tax=Streptomyces atratus TaxID=1893 RepID=UPI00369F3C08